MASVSGSFFENQIMPRGAALGGIPLEFVSASFTAVIGTAAAIGSLVTLGRSEGCNRLATDGTLGAWNDLLAAPYASFLQFLNPKAVITQPGNPQSWGQATKSNNAFSFIDLARFKPYAFNESPHLFLRHVVSRLSYALQGIALIVARIADFPIGLVAAILSCVTLGMFPALNDLAVKTLQVTGLVADILQYTIKTVNPWSTIVFSEGVMDEKP